MLTAFISKRTEATEVIISAYNYIAEQLKEFALKDATESFAVKIQGGIS